MCSEMHMCMDLLSIVVVVRRMIVSYGLKNLVRSYICIVRFFFLSFSFSAYCEFQPFLAVGLRREPFEGQNLPFFLLFEA